MDQFILLQLSGQDIKTLITDTIREELKKLPSPVDSPKDAEYLSKKEAAAYLGVSLPTLDKLVKQSFITPTRWGTVIRFNKNELSLIDNSKKNRRGHGR